MSRRLPAEEERMPAGGSGCEQRCREKGHPPATCHQDRAEDVPSHSLPPAPPPPFPTEMKKHEHAASLPGPARDHSPSPGKTGNGVREEDAPPVPSTELAFENKQEQDQHPLGTLPADILIGILSRVPYRSLCRFKCVSKPWLSLCSDPDIRKMCPQTLSGFFYNYHGRFKFHNLSGKGPPLVDASLPVLLEVYEYFQIEQCCSSLLLFKCWESRHEEDRYDYVVCNPVTGQWAVLPPVVWQDQEYGVAVYFEPIMDIFLGFDPTAPSRFVVFVPLIDCFCESTEMAIYSSETGRWTVVQSEWGDKTILVGNSECVFLDDTLHLATHNGSVVTVNAEGKVWREIEMPDNGTSCKDKVSIGQSQGRLYAWQIDNDHDSKLYVWVLQDYVSGKWTLEHTVAVSELFGRQCSEDDMSYTGFDEVEMAVSYDMDNQKVNVSCAFEEFQDVLPYIPCFAEWSSDCH